MVEKTRHRKIPEIVSWSETVACKGANLRISYDVQNRRVYRKADEDQSGSQETELYYVLDGNRVIEERVYSGDEDLKRDYWYGVYIDEPVFGRCDLNDDNDFDDTDEQFYYLHNTQYSVHAIIDTSGSIIEVYKNYQPYGSVDIYTGDGGDSDWWDGDETTGSLSSNYYLFTGRRYDPEADLMFYRNRMYSTSRGRFLQRDPIGYVDGLNLYRAYFVPLGMDAWGFAWYSVPHGMENVTGENPRNKCCDKWEYRWDYENFESKQSCIDTFENVRDVLAERPWSNTWDIDGLISAASEAAVGGGTLYATYVEGSFLAGPIGTVGAMAVAFTHAFVSEFEDVDPENHCTEGVCTSIQGEPEERRRTDWSFPVGLLLNLIPGHRVTCTDKWCPDIDYSGENGPQDRVYGGWYPESGYHNSRVP